VLHYLGYQLRRPTDHLRRISVRATENAVLIDQASQRNLDLVDSRGGVKLSLLGTLDRTSTPMGARKLRDWLLHPLCDLEKLLARQEVIAVLLQEPYLMSKLRESLKNVRDMERLTGRISQGAGNARDLQALASSLARIPALRDDLESLPGGGDMESWRYGQKNTACRDLEPERDALELELLADFTALGKPVLGICRGMQTINVFFGGDLVQDWPGHSAIEGVDRLHSVQNAPSFLRELYGERCMVNSCHHQIIGRLGTGLEVLQRAEDGVVEAFRHKTLPVWGIQWHPERLTADCQTGTVDGLAVYRAFLSQTAL